MNTYNSDGYILIDLKEADIALTTQHISGLYNRVAEEVAKVNKLAIVINAGDLTPLAAVVQKTLNYYVVTTSKYIFKINSNDILIIEEAGEVTVDVSIVPTLTEGVKVADFAIGSTEGSIYAPEFQTEINDSVTSDHLTWSSEKIDTELSAKADSSDLAEVATSGSYNDLSNKPTIPTKVSELQNDSGYITDSALSSYQTKTDANLQTTADTVVGAINELNEFNTMGAEIPISTTAPFVEYRVCGHLLFVQINTWDHAITSDETLGYIPNTITVLMQGRQYTSTGLIAIDKTNGRIWARNLATYSAFLFVLPIA